jgi:hypothetical protein
MFYQNERFIACVPVRESARESEQADEGKMSASQEWTQKGAGLFHPVMV